MRPIKAADFFQAVEDKVPLGLSLAGDQVGFIGPGDPESLDVEDVLLLMDYSPDMGRDADLLHAWDLLVLHHPPVLKPETPCYIIHSNWDIVPGGACDTLAECLNIETDGVLDEKTSLGRVGSLRNGPVRLARFAHEAMTRLRTRDLRIVNFRPDRMIERVGLVSGFGLVPDLVQTAHDKDVDLYLSGDLTHRAAMQGRSLGLVLVDAPHHATEVPGIFRLGELLREIGVNVRVHDCGVPWKTITINDSYQPGFIHRR